MREEWWWLTLAATPRLGYQYQEAGSHGRIGIASMIAATIVNNSFFTQKVLAKR